MKDAAWTRLCLKSPPPYQGGVMEVFPAGRACTASRASRSTRRGSVVVGGDELAGHPAGDGALRGFATVRCLNPG